MTPLSCSREDELFLLQIGYGISPAIRVDDVPQNLNHPAETEWNVVYFGASLFEYLLGGVVATLLLSFFIWWKVRSYYGPSARLGFPSQRSHFLLAALAIDAGFLFGYDSTIPGAVLLQVRAPAELSGLGESAMTMGEQSWFVSIMVLGAAVGSGFSGKFQSVFGRRIAIAISTVFYFVGVGIMLLAVHHRSVPSAIVSRFFCGFGKGLFTAIVPMFICECSLPKHRGILTFLFSCSVPSGQVLAGIVSSFFIGFEYEHGWLLALLGSVIFVCILLILSLSVYESPCFLMQNNEDAHEALEFYGITRDLADEMREEARVQRELPRSDLSSYYSDEGALQPLKVGVALQFAQQIAAPNVLMYFGSIIIARLFWRNNTADANPYDPFSDDNKLGTYWSVPVNIAQVIGSCASMFLVARYGRRPILFTSIVGVVICLFAMGGLFHLDHAPNALIIAMMIFYLILFGIGLGPVAWCVNGEIHPLRWRATSNAIVTATNWTVSFLVTLTFLPMRSFFSSHQESYSAALGHPDGVFCLYGVCTLITFAYLFHNLPETKDVPLDKIPDLFCGKRAFRGAHEGREVIGVIVQVMWSLIQVCIFIVGFLALVYFISIAFASASAIPRDP